MPVYYRPDGRPISVEPASEMEARIQGWGWTTEPPPAEPEPEPEPEPAARPKRRGRRPAQKKE